MHLSLDGFVAGPNGEMNWIKVDEDIFTHVGKRIAATDTALYGRTTFQMMENYWPTAGDKPGASKHDTEHSQWYKHARKVVLSKTLKEAEFTNTKIINENLADQLNAIKQEAANEILLFGSPTATHALSRLNLIDGYWLFVNPIILGNGIPLFIDSKDKIKLNLVSTHKFECGVVELNYTIAQ